MIVSVSESVADAYGYRLWQYFPTATGIKRIYHSYLIGAAYKHGKIEFIHCLRPKTEVEPLHQQIACLIFIIEVILLPAYFIFGTQA
ncbi:hypothetical protein SDC9_119997 [bioreactor metagenome]|uniref:Uncharacterized protein n=1 Tax=bioreactor metagenome TaxID=1076179 RepID=A0A645C7M3_9ZZZZ